MNPVGFAKNLIKILRAKPEIPESLGDHQLLKTIVHRRTVRSFTGKDVDDDVFRAILEAGRLAPSTVNLQTWTFLTFTRASWKEKFGRRIPFGGNRAVIILGDMHRTGQIITTFPPCRLVEYTIAVINASLAAMNMTLAAESLGLSSIMLSDTGRSGFFDARYLKESLSLPDGVFPLMTVVFGWAKGAHPPMPPKLPLETIVSGAGHYEETDMAVLEDWYDQMTAGFKATFPLSSFKGQLEYYRKNMEKTEKELHELIFHKHNVPSPHDGEDG